MKEELIKQSIGICKCITDAVNKKLPLNIIKAYSEESNRINQKIKMEFEFKGVDFFKQFFGFEKPNEEIETPHCSKPLLCDENCDPFFIKTDEYGYCKKCGKNLGYVRK